MSEALTTTNAAIRALLENPGKYGLTWNLTPGTVNNDNPLTVICDGDTVPISMVSMVGPLAVGQRVFVIQVPPGGNFVIGTPGTDPSGIYRDRKTLTTTAGSVIFTGIPSTLRSLRILFTARGTDVGATVLMLLRINNDASALYDTEFSAAVGAAAMANNLQTAATFIRMGRATGAGAGAGRFGSGTADIVGWDSPHSGFLGVTFATQAMAGGQITETGGGSYAGTGPYTGVALFPNIGSFVAGSDFQLVGQY